MSFSITSLPPLPPSQLSKKLPELRPLFFVPPLGDRPQNPIVDTLVEVSSLSDIGDLYEDVQSLVEVEQIVEEEEDLWTDEHVSAERTKPRNQSLSWDALRTTFPKHPTSTPFLSEQSNDVFDAVGHHVRPRLDDPSLQLRYILPTELLDLLAINMVGNSSPLYVWNADNERFVSNGSRQDARLVVIIEGLDELASASIIQRFLTIGTLMRRLETLVVLLQQRHGNPTMHSFSHALSTVLVHIRNSLTRQPPYSAVHLTSLWLYYGDTEALLFALASLCRRGETRNPPYEPLPDSPDGLLSHIYKCLERHIECRSPRSITATVAYILTTTSRDYFAHLGESLGLFVPSQAPWLRTNAPSNKDRHFASDILQLEDIDLDPSVVSLASEDSDQGDLPTFVPPELVEALPAARKSLRILQAADPNHPLCSMSAVATCEWVWSSNEIHRLWECRDTLDVSEGLTDDIAKGSEGPPLATVGDYKPDLERFRMFDLEPGAHLTTSAVPNRSPASLEFFIASFPDRLPPITPTLQHLATVVLQPLYTRTAVLSSSLLKLYLTSLHLEKHLTLLRSYLLLTLPSFKTRLIEALFSDADEYRHVGRGTRARTLARLGLQDARDAADAATPGAGQGIGLGYGLAERDTWPPGGADLSFFLRTVIVDSLEERRGESEDVEDKKVWREAEFRMGFALRDLPVGDGRERWLNPMSIEALDFLYLDYKPPHPLDVVITPDILSKYQRIFTFVLRLFRAQTVARIAFRSTFKSTGPVFPYTPQAQDMLVRLRFQIQAFVTSFVTYIFDSAIGSNFDAYMRRIARLRDDVVDETFGAQDHEITDVFSLEKSHSDLLDRILSGCVLRTTQRAAGDALREILELVLQFGLLVTNIRRGIVREAHGAEDLRELYELFQKQMILFIKAVQNLHAKASGHNITSVENLSRRRTEDERETESRSYFDDLLLRVDPTGWWRRKVENQGRHPL